MMNDVRLICAPFAQLYLPSYDTAVLKRSLQLAGVSVEVDMLYLKYAVCLGGDAYQSLYSSSLGDVIFSLLLFPENRTRLLDEYYVPVSALNGSLDDLLKKTEQFIEEYIDATWDADCTSKEVVLFHVYTKQLFPALYIGKRIFEKYGHEIWLSGYHCSDECGASLCRIFPYIKKVFGSNIEHAVVDEIAKRRSGDNSPRLSDSFSIPTPDYEDFLKGVAGLPQTFLDAFLAQYWFQIEFNRGCPWNRCSFCTLNVQYPSFKQRSQEDIISDYRFMQEHYKTTRILVTSRNSNYNWKDLVAALNKEYPGMRGTYDLSFKIADLFSEDDARFLSENDISILVGVESLSKTCLAKINKGQTVIESIMVLKYMERYRVKCFYNLMCGLPFETDGDCNETEMVISNIVHLPPPFSVERFRLTAGSSIQKNPELFDIKTIGIRKGIEGALIPDKLHGIYVPFFLDFESIHDRFEQRIERYNCLIETWTDKYYAYARKRIVRPKQHSLLYMRKNDLVLEIYDARFTEKYQIYTLCDTSKSLYEYCDKVRSIDDIKTLFPEHSEAELLENLNNLVNKKLMYKEDANYLSLAV